jgi:hypothetical protein
MHKRFIYKIPMTKYFVGIILVVLFMSNIKKIQALSLAKDCYSMKLDLLTNATVVDDAIRFISKCPKTEIESK